METPKKGWTGYSEQEKEKGKQWTNERLFVLTPDQLDALADGTKLTTVNGLEFVKGRDKLKPDDIRYGFCPVGFVDGDVPDDVSVTASVLISDGIPDDGGTPHAD